MYNKENTIKAFVWLGKKLSQLIDESNMQLAKVIDESCKVNYWFTRENIYRALHAITTQMLDEQKLRNWLANYGFAEKPKRVGIIMAGNIPLVGFHDLLCVLVSGNIAVVKASSKDKYLIDFICKLLVGENSFLRDCIVLTTKPDNIDLLIATGSNNSARFFNAEYKNVKSLIRKNRYSVAILNGNETQTELEALGDDIFSYFGLGCRNVSNIFIPKGYNWESFFKAMEKYSKITAHEGYNDCLRYHKAIFELNDDNYITNGFVILKQKQPSFSSISVINHTEYDNIGNVIDFITFNKENIQCVVGNAVKGGIIFGQTQHPELNDYADGINTMQFLLNDI